MRKDRAIVYNNCLREERIRHQWLQREVADRIGTTTNNVSRWELGQTTPSPYFRAKLCTLFGKSVQELGLLSESAAHEEQVPAGELVIDPSKNPFASTKQPLPLWTVPYPRNPHFTGRDPLLQELHSRLTQEHRVALSQSMVLSGLGGIGKTQAALEYAYRHAHGYTALFWIGAETAERLVSSFAALAETLQLPERLDPDQQRVVSAVKRWLMIHQGWLLIFDNVEDLEIVRPFVPTVPHGSLVFTTRLQAVGTLASVVTVETMGLAESTLFLLHRARLLPAEASLDRVSSELLAQAEALAIELDFLPLALDQAGAYIEEVGCSPATYLDLYQSHRKELLGRRGHTPSDHTESVATTWSLSFQRIEQRNPAAADLLRMCAFLEPDTIPEELLQEGCLTLGSLMHVVATDLLAFHEACEELSRFSLVQRDQEARLLRIHRLVQAVLKDMMETHEQEHWVECMIRATERLFPATVDASTWSVCQRLLPQAQMGSFWAELFSVISPQAVSLLLRTAQYLRDVSLYEQAKRLSQQVLAIRERMFTQEHLEMAQSLTILAQVLRQQGTYAEAEPLFQQALSIWEQHLGPEHPQVADPLNGLALLYWRQGRYAEAEPLYQRALAVREQSLGPEHPLVAKMLNNLALLYFEQGRYAEAEPLYQRAISINEQSLGPEHHDAANPLNNLAILYGQQGRYAEAEPLLRRALSIQEQSLGPEHHEVSDPLHNLANLYNEQSQYAEAEPLYQRALAIREQNLGPEHPLVAAALTGLGDIYRQQGRYAEAESLFQRALAIREQKLGPEHPLLAYTLTGLANLFADLGQYAEAESLFQRALAIREQQLGPEHPGVADTLHDFASLRERQGNCQEALVFYQRSLSIREQALGSTHPRTTKTRTCLLTLLQ